MNVLHPLFVHLHIAFLLMAFLAMAYWLAKGLPPDLSYEGLAGERLPGE